MSNEVKYSWQDPEQVGVSSFEKALVNKILASLGFDQQQGQSIKDAWMSVTDKYDRGANAGMYKLADYVGGQFKALFDLARINFNAPKELFEQFGIRHFGRYNKQELVEQLHYEPGVGDDVEILVTASDDWNTGFKNRYKSTKQDLQFKHPIYYESDSIVQLARSLVRASKRYGPISKLLISGHGNPELFVLGRKSDSILSGVVSVDHVQESKGAKRLTEREILSPDCEILISSCSVGKPGGVAQAISEATGLRVIAPDDIASGLYYDKKDGDYNARYRHRRRRGRRGDDAVIYDPALKS